MSNQVASTVSTNIVPVQGQFDQNGNCQGLIGPGGEVFFPPLVGDAITGVTIDRITTEIKEPTNETLVFKLPYYAIKSVRGADSTNQTTYTVYSKFTGTTSSASGGNCTLTVSTGAGTMGSAAETDNYQLIDNTTGKTVQIDPSNISPSGSSVTFTLSSTYASRAFIVIGTVTKTLSANTEKTKTLTTATPLTFTTQAEVTNPVLSLGVADAARFGVIRTRVRSHHVLLHAHRCR